MTFRRSIPLFLMQVFLLSSMVSCSSMQMTENDAELSPEIAEELQPPVLQQKVAEADSEMEKVGQTPTLPKSKSESDLAQHPALLVQLNRQVEVWIRRFTTTGKRGFEECLRKGNPFRKGIEATLKESGIPIEFYFLSLIESGFATHAVSHKGAVGFWQFMPGTAERYGLKTYRGFDERRDPLRATRAAATYLRDLYNVFGSWRLAMAAYNAGEYRILGGIMRGKTRDFWTLVEKKVLPKETMDYVPKFYAAAIIAKNPQKYGLSVPDPISAPEIALVDVPSPVSLASVAEVVGIDRNELATLNPHLQKGFTPQGVGTYGIWVPQKHVFALKQKQPQLSVLAARSARQMRPVSLASSSARFHQVRRGETLTAIARRYRTSVASIKRANDLRSNRVAVGQRLRVATVVATSTKAPSPAPVLAKKALNLRHYRVRPGDTLASISARFGSPIARLRSINELSSSRIYSGQLLRL